MIAKLTKLITILIMLFTLNLFSAESPIGVYGGLVFKPSLFSNGITYFSGSRLGIVINNKLALGLSVYSMTFNNYKPDYYDEVIKDNPYLEYNYYGAESEYFFSPKNSFYGSFHLFVGRGRANLNISEVNIPEGTEYTPQYTNVGYFTVVEPGINLYLSLRDYYRLSAGIGYRIAINSDLHFNTTSIIMDNESLSGPYIQFSVLFGSF